MPKHSRLLSPIRLGVHTVKNRIVSTAHGEHFCTGGLMNRRLIDYHVRRAEGGVGMMIVFGSGTVHPASDNDGNVSLWDERNEPALRELASRVRSNGTVLLAQATHRGPRETPTGTDASTAAPSPFAGLLPIGSPHVMTRRDIGAIVANYGRAAARLARCGFSGVEITSLGSHLHELFWSPTANRRTDAYGGSFENRMRFTREVIAEIDRSVPKDFLLAFRISIDPQTHTIGLTTEDLLRIAEQIDSQGRVDFFDVSGGSGANIETHAGNVPTDVYPTKTYAHLGEALKGVVGKPVLVAGRILTADDAESVLAAGQADLVGMTRALIAEPDLPRHIADGTEERARPCIAINEGCRRVTFGGALTCTVNPEIASPELVHLVPTVSPSRLLVVGGGPGGLEAARVAAMRGHRVTLVEQADTLGGMVVTAALDAERPHLRRHIDWAAREIDLLGVDVRTGVVADVDLVRKGNFDRIVVATGARAVLPYGLDPSTVTAMTDVQLLRGGAPVDVAGRVVFVFDAQAHRRGASAALTLAEKYGAKVRLATPALQPMAALERPNIAPFLRRFSKSGVEVLTSHELEVVDRKARIFHLWSDSVHDLGPEDVLVTVGWTEVDQSLSEALAEELPNLPVQIVGDAVAPRLMRNAISEGFKAGAFA